MTAAITLGWLIALVVLLSVGHVLPGDVRWWISTCVVGVVMGLFGLVYVPFLKRRRAGLAAEHDQLGQEAQLGQENQLTEPSPSAEPSSPAPEYVSRDSGSNTVSSTETPGNSTRS